MRPACGGGAQAPRPRPVPDARAGRGRPRPGRHDRRHRDRPSRATSRPSRCAPSTTTPRTCASSAGASRCAARAGGADEGWHLKLPVEGAGHGRARRGCGCRWTAGEAGSRPASRSPTWSPPWPAASRCVPGRDAADRAHRHTSCSTPSGTAVAGARRRRRLDHGRRRRGRPLPRAGDRGADRGRLRPRSGRRPAARPRRDAGHRRARSAAPSGPPPRTRPTSPSPPRSTPADPGGDAVHAHLLTHVRRFLLQDVRVRRDLPDSVHQMRVAARRLRSGLRVFRPAGRPGVVAPPARRAGLGGLGAGPQPRHARCCWRAWTSTPTSCREPDADAHPRARRPVPAGQGRGRPAGGARGDALGASPRPAGRPRRRGQRTRA